jgi:hypothetical protein
VPIATTRRHCQGDMISPKPLSDARGYEARIADQTGLAGDLRGGRGGDRPWTTEPRAPKAAPAAGATGAQRVNKSSLTVARPRLVSGFGSDSGYLSVGSSSGLEESHPDPDWSHSQCRSCERALLRRRE